ncbi:peptidase [Ruegeria phage vB_RpoMi-V15]|nr:M15 peptidase [Ruegeria phage DSS3-P22]AWY08873.1 peptidase [Ruegeria phage vB_RpoMi-V15]
MEFFRYSEFQCKCGCGMLPQPFVMDNLDHIRRALRVPLVIHSGARCARHNARVGGALLSQHVKGRAVDIRWPEGHQSALLGLLQRNGVRGIGIYPTFVHADWREGPSAFWVRPEGART